MQMKARLLSLVTMVMVAIGMHAQWTAPVAPESPFKGVDYEADGTTLYYIYNVGVGQFVTGANSWSTQISVGTNSEPVTEIVVEALDEEEAEYFPNAVKLRLNPNKEQKFNGASGERGFTGTYLFRDSGTSGFIDHASQPVWYWVLEKAESGNYYWHSVAGMDENYPDAPIQFASVSGEGAAVVFDASEEDANIEWAFIPVEGLDKELIPAYAEAMAIYTAKLNLYNTLLEAKDADVNTDAASAVYNNADATLDELKAAASKLKSDIKAAEFGDKWDGASEEDPLDVTEDVMVNPSFDFDSGMEGWTIKGATPATAAWDAQGTTQSGPMMGLEGDWGKNCEVYHATFDISQYIDFLPAGVYKFTCQGFYRADDEDVPAQLYAIFPDGSEQTANLATIDAYPTSERLYDNGEWPSDVNRNGGWVPNGMSGALYHFRHRTGDNEEYDYTSVLNIVVTEPIAGVTIGVRTTSAGTWVIFDNFKLTYYGQVDPNKLELQDLVKKNDQLYAASFDVLKANEEVKATYESAMDAARDADGNYEEILNNLKAATDALAASIKDYTELAEVYTSTRELADQLEAEHAEWEVVTETVSNLADEIQQKYEDGLADHDYLEAVRDSATNTIVNAIATGAVKINEGDDLTILLKNADFQKTVASNKEVPGWTTVSGEITELSKDWGDIEVYCKHANIQQTIKNMPVGAYDITVQGFVRGNNDKVQLYAGDSKTSFKNVGEEYATEPSFGTPEDMGWPYDNQGTLDDGTTVFYPNSMQGASEAFKKLNPVTGELFYTNHCRIVLTKAGDLTIGVNVDFADGDPEVWAIWDNFRIAYAGSSIDLFEDEIHNRQNALLAVIDDPDSFVTPEAKKLADEAIEAGDKALEGDNLDAVFAAMNQLEEALEYVQEAAGIAEELMNLAEFYESLASTIDSGDTAYLDLISKATFPSPEDFPSNEALKKGLQDLKEGWAGYVMYDVIDKASEENPQEVTEIIYAYDYIDPMTMEYSAKGWDVTIDGGAYAANFNELECYNNNSFEVSQTLVGLEPGFYNVSVEGYYRPGFPGNITDSLATVHNAELFITSGAGTRTAPLMNAMDGAQEMQEYVGAESEITLGEVPVYIPNDMEAASAYIGFGYYSDNMCQFKVTEDGKAVIGIRKSEHIEGDWTIFTNWKLYYLGKNQPDAVETISADENIANRESAIYDLSGRRISKLTRGLFISNGRKVVVK